LYKKIYYIVSVWYKLFKKQTRETQTEFTLEELLPLYISTTQDYM